MSRKTRKTIDTKLSSCLLIAIDAAFDPKMHRGDIEMGSHADFKVWLECIIAIVLDMCKTFCGRNTFAGDLVAREMHRSGRKWMRSRTNRRLQRYGESKQACISQLEESIGGEHFSGIQC